VYYYQLKQFDYDGAFELSEIVSAKIIGKNFEEIRVFDLLGHFLFLLHGTILDAQQQLTEGMYSDGLYLIQIHGRARLVKRFYFSW
jgi:hypothetical protein